MPHIEYRINMSKEWLKRFRIIIPGIIILILLIPFFVEDLNFGQFLDSLNLVQGILFFVIVGVLGSIYYVLNLRRFTFDKPIIKINNNIKNKLISFCKDCKVTPHNCQLKKNKTLMHVFYRLIDNDKSLTQKSKSVMLNGLVLSSVADTVIISFGFTISYLVAFFFTEKFHFILATGIILLISIVAKVLLLPKATEKHISLSNDQLDFIKVHYQGNVRSKLKELCPYHQESDASNSRADD